MIDDILRLIRVETPASQLPRPAPLAAVIEPCQPARPGTFMAHSRSTFRSEHGDQRRSPPKTL
ncbi:hypothetical protein Cme02nite_51400 [Catellatospora methionotrophica]|uniref:Uncharacterized protein n=1 Tax=Catellatospora methionotrophica TaxID=121620 RepID=A0A8J3L9F1_9ACTN|nr:hypothetical protein Cme02nite_51400 [Catellatospora methionotrophica]